MSAGLTGWLYVSARSVIEARQIPSRPKHACREQTHPFSLSRPSLFSASLASRAALSFAVAARRWSLAVSVVSRKARVVSSDFRSEGDLGDAIFAVLCGCGHNIHEILAHLRALFAQIIAAVLDLSWAMQGRQEGYAVA